LAILSKVSIAREHIVTRFVQEFDKPGEKKVETPWEQRQREQKEKEAEEAGETIPKKEDDDKSPEQIKTEQAAIEKQFRAQFDKATSDEKDISLATSKLLTSSNETLKKVGRKAIISVGLLKMAANQVQGEVELNAEMEAVTRN